MRTGLPALPALRKVLSTMNEHTEPEFIQKALRCVTTDIREDDHVQALELALMAQFAQFQIAGKLGAIADAQDERKGCLVAVDAIETQIRSRSH